MESKSKRARKPSWTEEQCLLLAQLVDEHKAILKGNFGPGVTAREKKQTWEHIAQTINGSFPLLVRTREDCYIHKCSFLSLQGGNVQWKRNELRHNKRF